MSRLTNVLLGVFSIVVATGAGAFARSAVQLDLPLAVCVGGLVLLACWQGHLMILRRHERQALKLELRRLHEAQRIMGDELERARQRISETASETRSHATARNSEIISEVRILETLVQQLASGLQTKALDKLDAALKTVPPRANHRPEFSGVKADPASIFEQLSEAELIDIVRAALNDERIELYLQPIVSLPQRKVRFYEALARLRTADGRIITPPQYMQIAESTGLITVVDNLLAFRCAQTLRALVEQNPDVRVFCNVSSHTIEDQNFFPQFLDFLECNMDLSHALLFELGQATYESCSPHAKANLARLADLGYRFSLDKVAHLDLDLAQLRERSFKFVKVTPALLLSTLSEEERAAVRLWALDEDVFAEIDDGDTLDPPAASAILGAERESDEATEPQAQSRDVAPSEQNSFKDRLTRYGLDLIVEKIETEREAMEVIELDVDYGQGYLFGEPRPSTNERLAETLPDSDGEDDVTLLRAVN